MLLGDEAESFAVGLDKLAVGLPRATSDSSTLYWASQGIM